MHIYFSGIGGSGLSALAMLCLDLGYVVSGTDQELSTNVELLQKRGANIRIGQDGVFLSEIHAYKAVDWFIHTPGVKPGHPELEMVTTLGIKTSKQNGLVLQMLKEHDLKLIAVAGTHGKTTTTAMISWLFKSLHLPVSHIIGSNIPFGNSGQYEAGSRFFVYEADEYDRKFLELHPYVSVIPALDYDHPDTYPTIQDYHYAFQQFMEQTEKQTIVYSDSLKPLKMGNWVLPTIMEVSKTAEPLFNGHTIDLVGKHNRENALLALEAAMWVIMNNWDLVRSKFDSQEQVVQALIDALAKFPGTERRMERLASGLFSDYAHHPVEIAATLQSAREYMEKSADAYKKLVAVYQPHQNVRQHELKDAYTTCFNLADTIYWLPTYLARENKEQEVLTPDYLSRNLVNRQAVVVESLGESLTKHVAKELQNSALVVVMGAGTVDMWARQLAVVVQS